MLKKNFFLQNLQRLCVVLLHGTRWSPLLRWSSRIPRSRDRARRSAPSQGITVRTKASVPRVWKVALSTSRRKCICGRPKWNPCVTSSVSITMSWRCARRQVLQCDVFFCPFTSVGVHADYCRWSWRQTSRYRFSRYTTSMCWWGRSLEAM